mmetsp:Transcript_5092/g.11120  ORF Transcript_5092/g.11120 Transcript_5092/m.11120 type:complete len:112 (+) Transcript_5092:263-598(+)
MDREINQSLQDKEIRAQIEARLRDSGEREKLKALLRDRLIDCGWRDDLKEHCKGGVGGEEWACSSFFAFIFFLLPPAFPSFIYSGLPPLHPCLEQISSARKGYRKSTWKTW